MKSSDRMRGVLELVGSGAVLVGLIFVGLELRQNTAAMEAASLQNQTDASTNFLTLVAADADLARVWIEGQDNPRDLNKTDAFRYLLLTRARWLRMQNAYLQWRRGMLTDDDWNLYEGLICDPEATGGMQFVDTWGDHRPALAGDFVAFVDECWASNR